MKLTKKVYQNKKLINTFEIENKEAYIELTNLLLNKIGNKYKIKIKKDSVYNEIKASLFFNHTDFNNNLIAKYKYEYLFTDVDALIDLH